MILANIGHTFTYEILNICRLFYFNHRFTIIQEQPIERDYILTQIRENKLYVKICLDGKNAEDTQEIDSNVSYSDYELLLSRLLFSLLAEFTGYYPRWGILTGIRPIKLFHRAFEQGMSEDDIKQYFKQNYLVREDIIDLSIAVAHEEKKINDISSAKSFSLYVAIPFCPTKCSYCSFVSSAMTHAKKLIEPYLDKLMLELAEIGRVARQLDLKLETIYIGGGTPTTLTAAQLTRLFECIAEQFDTSTVLEYTVEAGRPDTIDAQKLQAIKLAGVTRLSINPQTLSDDVLKAVGRTHSTQELLECYQLAKSLGFDAINMDLIAGLPTDTFEGFTKSVDGILALQPANITVHTLTVKRASSIFAENIALASSVGEVTTKMVDYARKQLMESGYLPYYLYRQKNTIANLENIGYAKSGYQGLYNVYIMDETHSILSAGAGGVTKLRGRKTDDIERINNYKYPFEYINQFDEIIKRKQGILTFYKNMIGE